MKTPPRPRRFQRPDLDSTNETDGWEVAIAGDLTEKQHEILENLMDVAPRSSGTIFFESCGGSAYVGLGLATLIRLRGLRATGVVLGECSSAALLPFAACERRVVTAHSSLFFHPVRWQSEEEVNLEEAAEWTRHFKVLEEDLDALLSRLFKVPLETLTRWTRPGKFLTGKDLVAAGLAELVDLFSGDLEQQLAIK